MLTANKRQRKPATPSAPRQPFPVVRDGSLWQQRPASRPAPFPCPLCSSPASVPLAARLGRQLARAGHLLEGDARVVGAAEPVEAPVAAGLERGREVLAVGLGVHAAIPVTPAVGRRAILLCARIVDADAAARDLSSQGLRNRERGAGARETGATEGLTARSKWLAPRSPPVLVACTTNFLPWTGPLVKVSS